MTWQFRAIHAFFAAGVLIGIGAGGARSSAEEQAVTVYPDRRPAACYRLDAMDQGIVYLHGKGPGRCDLLGARDVTVWQHGGKYYMHYDGAGPSGWVACLATSPDGVRWTARGPALALGAPGSADSASASYGTVYFDGGKWHMFYLGTPHTSPAPELIPAFPYLTMKAESRSPLGPWTKRYDITPFVAKAGSYYAGAASPGCIVKQGDEYRMLFSASTVVPTLRTLGYARTKDLEGSWTPDARPFLPAAEQIENASLYFEKANDTWFLFTNHVGLKDGLEYTDAIWVYWTKDLDHWNPADKAVVLDGRNCRWSKHIVGLPSVVPIGGRLAIFYDGNRSAALPAGAASHMDRDIGLAWLALPLKPPTAEK